MNKNQSKDSAELKAVALKHDETSDNAPRIVGLGQGYVAEKMLETAREHSIPVVEEQTLADVLSGLSLGDEIPEELYQAVAEILVFISRLDYDKGRGRYSHIAVKKD